jgi:hypothetical protein
MRYLAAIAAFVITYFIAAVAYAELVPQSWEVLRARPGLLSFFLLAICLISAVVAVLLVG